MKSRLIAMTITGLASVLLLSCTTGDEPGYGIGGDHSANPGARSAPLRPISDTLDVRDPVEDADSTPRKGEMNGHETHNSHEGKE